MDKVNSIRECRAFTAGDSEKRLPAGKAVHWRILFELFKRVWSQLHKHGFIKTYKGRRKALPPAYIWRCISAAKSEPADSAETAVFIRLQGTVQRKTTGNLLGKPLGKPMGKPLGIPLNVNLNGNPNPGQTQCLTGGTNPRAGDGRGRRILPA